MPQRYLGIMPSVNRTAVMKYPLFIAFMLAALLATSFRAHAVGAEGSSPENPNGVSEGSSTDGALSDTTAQQNVAQRHANPGGHAPLIINSPDTTQMEDGMPEADEQSETVQGQGENDSGARAFDRALERQQQETE
jgi:hypothetical protein